MAIKRKKEQGQKVTTEVEEQMVFDDFLRISVDPESIYKTQDKISNMLPQLLDVREKVLRSGSKVTLLYDQISSFEPSLTQYDVSVLSGFLTATLQNYNSQTGELGCFSIKQLARFIIGKDCTSGISAHQINKIKNSLRKMSHIEINIDITNEFDKYNFVGVEPSECTISGMLISYEAINMRLGGSKVTCYKPLSIPLLYRYAMPKHQMYSHDMALLYIDSISKSDNVIAILDFLLRHTTFLFQNLKTRGFVNNGILFDTLYDLTDINKLTNIDSIKSKKKRLKADIIAILDAWVERKHLLGYEIVKKGNKVYKVVISVNPNTPFPPRTVYEIED